MSPTSTGSDSVGGAEAVTAPSTALPTAQPAKPTATTAAVATAASRSRSRRTRPDRPWAARAGRAPSACSARLRATRVAKPGGGSLSGSRPISRSPMPVSRRTYSRQSAHPSR